MDKKEIEKKMLEANEAETKRTRPAHAAHTDAGGTGNGGSSTQPNGTGTESKLTKDKASRVPDGAHPDGADTKSPSTKDEISGVPDGAVPVGLPLAEMTDLVMAQLVKQPEPGLVLYGGVPHRIVRRTERGGARHIIQQHNEESLLGHVARRVEFVKRGKDERWQLADPPARVIRDLLALPCYPEGIPCVDHIKSVPLMTDDGELIATSGLHPEYRVFLALDPALEGMRLPKKITKEDIYDAVAVISDPFVDFPFDEPSSANVIGMLFAMVFRECVGGLTPLFVLDANSASTGKTTLASVLSVIAYGHDAKFGSGNVNSEELRKRLFALAAQGTRFHVLDNVERIIWSPELSAFLTAPNWEDRKLGVSETYTFPNNMLIALTGNHVRIGGDIWRRTVLIRLRNESERPEQTVAYTHEPIIPYVLTERANILRAMYVVLAAWHQGGRLVPEWVPRMASFQEWANFSAGILDTIGFQDELLGNRDEVRGRDTDAEEYALMLVRGRQQFGARPFFAKELLSALEPEDMPTCVGASAQGSLTRRMGRLLVRIEDRSFGDEGLTIRAAGEENHTRRYRIESREERTPATGTGGADGNVDNTED